MKPKTIINILLQKIEKNIATTEDRIKEHQLTVTYTPQQNGVSERKNRIVMEMTRYLLEEKGLPKKLWAKAVYTVVYIQNQGMTKAIKDMTPLEAWSGYKSSIKHFRVFGSIYYFHIQEQKRGKLDTKAKKGIFIGYSSQSRGYRMLNLEDEKIVISRDVTFDENASWNW